MNTFECFIILPYSCIYLAFFFLHTQKYVIHVRNTYSIKKRDCVALIYIYITRLL